ncbi:helix-turn-helix domain-containing protein [Phytoactinopolyspora sp. XMNu-373]|uniref:Helix-turn-helix domain-containing protein n=2 Tax=Phytoactinopolyspora mesophila TaxID=2650750 RepID=A0A7K3MBL8_9ACTN|nr:helix-turn-helix domain-containing protein [Phytoactinopolyspora mesophila]NDL60709.1 helix-turn-helix domain-containing protein [Phytoactinopolyspora mesophila]
MATAEAGELLRVPAETVRYWRYVGKGPKSFRAGGRRVLYAREDVEALVVTARAEGAA